MPEEGFFRAGRTRPGPNIHGPRPGPSGNSRAGGGSSRRPRWDTDAGITDRDVAALRWLGQQYAARSDVLRVLLGRRSPGSLRIEGQLAETTLRDVVTRWEDRGLIERDRLLGFQCVAPTVKALPAAVGIAAAITLAGRMVRRAGQQVGRRRTATAPAPGSCTGRGGRDRLPAGSHLGR